MTDEGLKGSVQIVEPTRAERTIGRRAAETRATVPELSLSAEVDMTRPLAVAEERSVSLTAILVRGCGLGFREHPRANGAYRDGRFELYSRVNAGVAMPSGEVATVFDADVKSLEQLTVEIDELVRRASELTSPEQSGATFSLARYGVTRAEALITTPHAVALAAGEVREVAAVRGDEVVPARAMSLTATYDHRILYGQSAAALITRIRELLERAEL
jgi:pyruvate dehydrogenase E2 component (dihydrolipoamide acetyltransferase)